MVVSEFHFPDSCDVEPLIVFQAFLTSLTPSSRLVNAAFAGDVVASTANPGGACRGTPCIIGSRGKPFDTLARFAPADAQARTTAHVGVLAGGTATWAAAGYPLDKGVERLTGPADDVMWKALDRTPAEREAAIREYLTWEVDLVNATYSDPDFGFRRFA